MENQTAQTDAARAARRAQRDRARRQRQRQRRRRLARRFVPGVAAILAIIIVAAAALHFARGGEKGDGAAGSTMEPSNESGTIVLPDPLAAIPLHYSAAETADTVQLGDEIDSDYAILIDVESGKILAEKGARERISPASMTKVMTVLVAAEQLDDAKTLDDTYTVPIEITDYCYQHGCSAVGFSDGETVPVRDLFYGTVLPSGADAAMSLAEYTAGSAGTFAGLMNDKLAELGLSDSAHFTNSIGLYGEDHYCTVYDMAMILEAAVDNELCRQILSAHTYTTAATQEHPQGIELSNWFLRRIEDKDTAALTVQCAKTGYVVQSGSCAASYAEDADGHGYLCVTAMAGSSWSCIYDHAALYQKYTGTE